MQGRIITSFFDYNFGFNGKEKDDEAKGVGNEISYGERVYDPRVGRFLSLDPIAGKYPFYSPYEYAGNSPIKFIDLDGKETEEDISKYWDGQPLINMSSAPPRGYNAAGVPRNSVWFFKEQLSAKPEMFSEANKIRIDAGRNPVVDETWVKFNPSHSEYLGETLWHHHIEGGEMAAAIPEQLNYDYFSELHPYLNTGSAIKGIKISGLLGGTLSLLGNVSIFTGIFTGNPDSWGNAFGWGEPKVGDIKKDWANTQLYVQIMAIVDHYIPVLDDKGKQVVDSKTGQLKYRLGSKTVTGNIYSGYIWNSDSKKYEGVNKITTRTEEWHYDENGNRTSTKTVDKSEML